MGWSLGALGNLSATFLLRISGRWHMALRYDGWRRTKGAPSGFRFVDTPQVLLNNGTKLCVNACDQIQRGVWLSKDVTPPLALATHTRFSLPAYRLGVILGFTPFPFSPNTPSLLTLAERSLNFIACEVFGRNTNMRV